MPFSLSLPRLVGAGFLGSCRSPCCDNRSAARLVPAVSTPRPSGYARHSLGTAFSPNLPCFCVLRALRILRRGFQKTQKLAMPGVVNLEIYELP
jgi:hypothetical protein